MVLTSSGFSLKGLATFEVGDGGTAAMGGATGGVAVPTAGAISGIVATGMVGGTTGAVGTVGSGDKLVAGVTDGVVDGEATKGVARTEGEISATRSGLIGAGVGVATG